MKRQSKNLFTLSLLSMLALASTTALADDHQSSSGNSVFLQETGTSFGETLNLKLPINPNASGNYFAGSLNISVGTTSSNGTSFLAFCIDPFQYSSSSTLRYRVTGLSALGSSQASNVSNLYAQSYASTLGNSSNSAAFQLALWELAKDDGNLSSGYVRTTGSTNAGVLASANTMIGNAKSGAAGSGQYTFNMYTNSSNQDYLVATSVSPVPEPESYAMLLAGLGLLGFTIRKRQLPA